MHLDELLDEAEGRGNEGLRRNELNTCQVQSRNKMLIAPTVAKMPNTNMILSKIVESSVVKFKCNTPMKGTGPVPGQRPLKGI